jgi:hypothetical protein
MFKKYVHAYYMIGNHDLAPYIKRDLYHKLGGHYTRGSNTHCDIVCYASYYHKNKLNNNIYYGSGKHKIPFQTKLNKSILSLDKFLFFAQNKFKSQHCFLYLWGHGYIWQYILPFVKKYNETTNNIKLPDYSFDSSKKDIKVIKINELNNALKKYKIDALVFETCAGMNLESIYELKDNVKYICGVCDFMSYNGIDHKEIIKYNSSPKNICKKIVESMDKEKCPSFIETKKTSHIKKKINTLSKLLLKNRKFIKKIIKNIRKDIIDNNAIDIGYLLSYIIHNTKSNRIKYEAEILYKYLQKNIYCVPKGKYKGNKCVGINIYFPRRKKEYLSIKNEYKQLNFNTNNDWIKVINYINK